MQKNIIIFVGLLLVGIIAWQAYLLGKKDAAKVTNTPDQPKITVEIEKPHTPRTLPHAAANNTITPEDEKQIEAKLKEDFNRLFRDLFDNPKVKAQIQQNMTQMQQQLQEGMSEFQRALVEMSAQLQHAAKEDTMLQELFKNFNMPKMAQFEDKGDHYEIHLDVPKNAKSSVDIKVRKGFLVVLVHQVLKEKHEENGVLVEKELTRKKQIVVRVPQDALIEKMQTDYKAGDLKITVPKIAKTGVAA